MIDKLQFYEKSFQPIVRFDDAYGYVVQLGPEATFGILGLLAKDIDVWIHEFVEFGIYALLTEIGKLNWITWVYERDGEYIKWTQNVSHIVTSSICKSWLGGRIINADIYWNEIQNVYSKRLSPKLARTADYICRDGFTELVDGLL